MLTRSSKVPKYTTSVRGLDSLSSTKCKAVKTNKAPNSDIWTNNKTKPKDSVMDNAGMIWMNLDFISSHLSLTIDW